MAANEKGTNLFVCGDVMLEFVHVFGTGEANAALLKDVEHLKFKAIMHRRSITRSSVRASFIS